MYIHIGCGGECDDSDGWWWCEKCQDYIDDEEVEDSIDLDEWIW